MSVVLVLLGLTAAAEAVLICRLLRQMEDWAELLEKTPAGSNIRLGAAVRYKAVLRAAQAINCRLDESQKQTVEARCAGRELQYSIAAVSHDIRTPLAGAMGYLELLQETTEPERQQQYLKVIHRRLQDLGGLLDALFLYTRLAGEETPLECEELSLFDAVCETLAALYPKLQQAGVEPQLHFEEETSRCRANAEALSRVLRNLVLNAVQHGAGDLVIRQQENELLFCNRVAHPETLDPARMFDRFWRADPARGQNVGGAGLGLSIVRQLVQRMDGRVEARLQGEELMISLYLPPSQRKTDGKRTV